MRKHPNKPEIIEYKGIIFRRYPTARDWASRNYYVPGFQWRRKGIKRLHQEIYIDHYGSIPEGHEIHHKDGNPLNNDPLNLEALSEADHREHHAKLLTDEQREARRQLANRIRPKTKNWHGSVYGRAWHQEQAREAYKNRKPISKVCEVCKATFETTNSGHGVRFCSNKCKTRSRYRSGVDNEERICIVCQTPFTTNKYLASKCCSMVCAGRSRFPDARCSQLCQHCGQAFTALPSQRRKFCSRGCVNAARRIHQPPTS